MIILNHHQAVAEGHPLSVHRGKVAWRTFEDLLRMAGDLHRFKFVCAAGPQQACSKGVPDVRDPHGIGQ